MKNYFDVIIMIDQEIGSTMWTSFRLTGSSSVSLVSSICMSRIYLLGSNYGVHTFQTTIITNSCPGTPGSRTIRHASMELVVCITLQILCKIDIWFYYII